MTLQDFYHDIGGSYYLAMNQLQSEKRIIKYLTKFLDMPEYEEMLKGVSESDREKVFRMSHSLKGMALNLALTQLANYASNFCDLFRESWPDNYLEQLNLVSQEEKFTVDRIKILLDNLES